MDVTEYLAQLTLTSVEVRRGKSLQVLDDLAVNQHACAGIACPHPGSDQGGRARAAAQKGVEDTRIKQVAAHVVPLVSSSWSPGRSSMSGVGGVSRRHRRSVSSMSSGRSAQAPASRSARAPRGSMWPL